MWFQIIYTFDYTHLIIQRVFSNVYIRKWAFDIEILYLYIMQYKRLRHHTMCNRNRWKHSKYQVGDVDKYVVLEVRVPWKIITGSKLDTSKWNVILSCVEKG